MKTMDVSFSEKLDAILKRLPDNKVINNKESFVSICKGVANTTDKYEVDELRKTLIGDGYIKATDFGDGDPPNITHLGKAFMRLGGYTGAEKQRVVTEEIKRRTVRSLKQSGWSIIISTLALLVATASFVVTLFR